MAPNSLYVWADWMIEYMEPMNPRTPIVPATIEMAQHSHHTNENVAGRLIESQSKQGRTKVVGVTPMAPMRPIRSPKNGIRHAGIRGMGGDKCELTTGLTSDRQ
jgi:hypothetical protein